LDVSDTQAEITELVKAKLIVAQLLELLKTDEEK